MRRQLRRDAVKRLLLLREQRTTQDDCNLLSQVARGQLSFGLHGTEINQCSVTGRPAPRAWQGVRSQK